MHNPKKVGDFFYVCDRCMTTGYGWYGGVRPSGWRRIVGKDLCSGCTTDLEAFLVPVRVPSDEWIRLFRETRRKHLK